jgi:xanthine dehydrogenase large subunit
MLTIEAAMDHMASTLDIDPVDVRLRNLYRPGNDETPYGQKVTDFRLGRMMDQLIEQSHYRQRRQGIAEFNARQSYLRRGLALTPVKFGISFTATHLNQAGALIHIYSDGSVHLNHGGTEMGQGLLTKVQQIVASAFGVSTALVQVSATATDKVPNTSPTAASSGTDLNAMAALDAANQIKARLIAFLAQGDVVGPGEFSDGKVRHGDVIWDWADLIQAAYLNRVSLSATGFYKTPDIHFDRATGKGQPFYYYAFGVACSEVVVDTTTGEYRLSQVDILHDVGRSLNPALDQGQIEGGFVQGLG